MLFASDVDGVIDDQCAASNRWALETDGQPWIEPTCWEWFNAWDRPERFVEFLHDPAFWRTVRPFATAVPALRRIVAAGHDVVFITARPEAAHDITRQHLASLGFSQSVYFTTDKAPLARSLHVDLAVDDHPPTVAAYLTAGVNAYLMDRQWNQDAPDCLPRLFGWEDVVTAIEFDAEWKSATDDEGVAW